MSTYFDNSKSELQLDYGVALMNPAAGHAAGVVHLGPNSGYNAFQQ